MKLVRDYLVPRGSVTTQSGKTYQQGQTVPAGEVLLLTEEAAGELVRLGYLEKPKSKRTKESEGGEEE